MNQDLAQCNKRCQARPSLPSVQAGVGLIEVLIAVLVLSIGLLGLAALQTRALGNTGSSTTQTLATIASYSILEAMRIDKTVALAGTYNQSVSADNCPAGGGSLAATQINYWCTQLKKSLGATANTQGTVNCNSVGLCTITVKFDNSKATSGPPSTTAVIATVTTRAAL